MIAHRQRDRVVSGVSLGNQCCAGFLGAVVVQTKVTPYYRTVVAFHCVRLPYFGLSLIIAFLKIACQVATKRVLQGCYS